MLTALLTFAAEEAHHGGDKTPFYVMGGLLAGWAVLVAGLGISRHETFPGSQGTKAGVMGITTLLVLGAMASAILTA